MDLNSLLNGVSMKDISLFKVVSNENSLLEKNIQYFTEAKATFEQKSKYENDQVK